jgi:hypothetical protein
MLALSTFVVGLRILSRQVIAKNMWLDDYFILVAMVNILFIVMPSPRLIGKNRPSTFQPFQSQYGVGA